VAVLGTFEQAVLLALAHPKTTIGKEGYGRAILKEVEFRLDRAVAAGAVYATLDRLEQRGLISSETRPGGEQRGGLPRRYFALEPEGVHALNEARAVVDRIWAGVPRPIKGAL
jgi:DNA-binding PadR family transcriptional regulator